MAESDAGPRATGTVSTEEAERLSERFRPSWEDDPVEPPLSSAITRPLPVVAVTAGTKATVPQLAPVDAPPREAPQPTLVGISPEPPSRSPAEELDWEVPPKETPSSAAQTQRLQAVPLPVASPAPAQDSSAAEPEISIQVDVEELPPPSKPSGIGEKYVPKEEGAPPVVLNEDVKAAEIGAQAALEAQHRARRAPTILRMKAADIPVPSAPVAEGDEDVPFAPRRSGGTGKLVVLGLVVAALAAAGVIFLRSGAQQDTAPASTATARATVAPDTAAPPPPPAPEPAKPAPEAAPTVAAAAAPAPASAAPTAEPSAPAKEAHAPKASTAASKPPAAPKTAPVPKAGPLAAKPAPKTTTTKTSGKAAIVRDAPF